MFCESPKGHYPCGKCRACKLKVVNEKMIISVFAAAEYRKKGQFLTLTYNDEHLPNGLQHADFAGFMKRLRKLDGNRYVKMYVAGEYGEKSGREHFHVLFYNYRYPLELIERAWRDPKTKEPIGFVYDGTLTPKAIKYVSGYVNKKGYNPDSGKRPPYGRSSCGIPDGLTPDEIKSMCETGKIHYNGRNFTVPRNWRRKYIWIWRHFKRDREEMPYEGKDWTPEQVRAMMDYRDMQMSRKRRSKRV